MSPKVLTGMRKSRSLHILGNIASLIRQPMRPSAHDTVVRSISGRPELRHVTQVQEWRIERAMDSDGFVISIIAPGGESQSFLVARADAHDIGEVLRRKAVWVDRQGQ